MARQLRRIEGEQGYENLIHSIYPPVDVFSISLRAGQGALTRGTVLALSGGELGTEEWVVLGTEPVTRTVGEGEEAVEQVEVLTANCILAELVDTGTGNAVHGIAYRSGHFNRLALIVADGHTISLADREALRQAGILLSDTVNQ